MDACRNADIFYSENWVTNRVQQQIFSCGSITKAELWMTPALRLDIRKQIITVETLTNVSCVPLKNKAQCHSQHFWTSRSSLITRHIKHIMKMKLQHIGKKCVTSLTKKHKYSLCPKKIVSSGHEGGKQREAAALGIDLFPFYEMVTSAGAALWLVYQFRARACPLGSVH